MERAIDLVTTQIGNKSSSVAIWTSSSGTGTLDNAGVTISSNFTKSFPRMRSTPLSGRLSTTPNLAIPLCTPHSTSQAMRGTVMEPVSPFIKTPIHLSFCNNSVLPTVILTTQCLSGFCPDTGKTLASLIHSSERDRKMKQGLHPCHCQHHLFRLSGSHISFLLINFCKHALGKGTT